MPGLCLQMLLRGRNTVGYTPYPTKVTTSFVAEAAAGRASTSSGSSTRSTTSSRCGRRSRPYGRPARTVAEVALCYTGDLNSTRPRTSTPSTTTCGWPRRSSTPGRTSWRSRTWPGCSARRRRRKLVTALRRAVRPAGAPAHPRHRRRPAGHADRGGRRRGGRGRRGQRADGRRRRSQPPASALVAALENTERATNLDLRAVMDLEPYWEAVRKVYTPFESGLPSPTGRVYDHEIPGGQLSNLRQQAIALGLGEKFEQIEAMYTAANKILGRPTKVTPSSKVVGDLALHLVAVGADPDDFAENPQNYDIPDSVIGFLGGELGDPPGGWPEPFRTKALQGRTVPLRDVELSDDGLGRRSTSRAGAPGDAEPAALPGPDQGVPGRPGDLRQRRPARHPRLPLRAAARRGARRPARQGRQPDPRPGGDRRRRRARHAHGDVHDQRPAPADPGPGQVDQGRRQGGRAGRPDQAGPRGRPVRRRGHASRWPRATRSRPARPWPPSRR